MSIDISSYFDRSVKKYGQGHKALGWRSTQRQYLRYNVLSLLANWEEAPHILDVGCGQGDFYDYIQNEHLNCTYTGIDISAEMIRVSKSRFPQTPFIKKDLSEMNDKYVDYAFACGTFNLKQRAPLPYIHAQIDHLMRVSKKGCAFNLLSTFAKEASGNDTIFQYFNPNQIVDFCFSLSPFVSLNHTYLTNDFTIFMYHNA